MPGFCSAWWCRPASAAGWCSTAAPLRRADRQRRTRRPRRRRPRRRAVLVRRPRDASRTIAAGPRMAQWGARPRLGRLRPRPMPRSWPMRPTQGSRVCAAGVFVAARRAGGGDDRVGRGRLCDLDLVVIGGGRGPNQVRCCSTRCVRRWRPTPGWDFLRGGLRVLPAETRRRRRPGRRGRLSSKPEKACPPSAIVKRAEIGSFWLIGGRHAILGGRSTEDRRSPRNRLKVRTTRAAPRRRTRLLLICAPRPVCVGGVRRFSGLLPLSGLPIDGPHYEEACMAKADKATAVADIAEQFQGLDGDARHRVPRADGSQPQRPAPVAR